MLSRSYFSSSTPKKLNPDASCGVLVPKQNIILNENSLTLIASGMNNSEIKEWLDELLDNQQFMGEENIKANNKKLDQEESKLDEQLAEKRIEEQKLAEEEKEAETIDHLRMLELESREKNAILEIMLKV